MTITEAEVATESTTTSPPRNIAHIIDCPDDQPSAKEWLAYAKANGLEVEALCGARWIPHRDPNGLDVCDVCLDIAQIRVVL